MTVPQPIASFAPRADEPFYLPCGEEVNIFTQCHKQSLAVMLKGPTGCGKTRLVEYMAWKLKRPLITVACHDDLSANDLIGRYLIRDWKSTRLNSSHVK